MINRLSRAIRVTELISTVSKSQKALEAFFQMYKVLRHIVAICRVFFKAKYNFYFLNTGCFHMKPDVAKKKRIFKLINGFHFCRAC